MFRRKCQISLFVIVGIIIVFGGGLLILLSTSEKEERTTTATQSTQLLNPKETVEDCFETALLESQIVLIESGLVLNATQALNINESSIPIFLDGNAGYVPSESAIEDDLRTVLEIVVPFCISDDGNTTAENMEISNWDSESITVQITIPYIAEGRTYTQFKVSQSNLILLVLESVQGFIELQEKDLSVLPMSDLAFLALENDFMYAVFHFDEQHSVFLFDFEREGYTFQIPFAVKYGDEEG